MITITGLYCFASHLKLVRSTIFLITENGSTERKKTEVKNSKKNLHNNYSESLTYIRQHNISIRKPY